MKEIISRRDHEYICAVQAASSKEVIATVRMSGGEAPAKSLVREGVEVVFGILGIQMYGGAGLHGDARTTIEALPPHLIEAGADDRLSPVEAVVAGWQV